MIDWNTRTRPNCETRGQMSVDDGGLVKKGQTEELGSISPKVGVVLDGRVTLDNH